MTSSLGLHTSRGAFWTISFSLLNKIGALVSQIVLAKFLFPDDFGLAGMVFSITSIASMISGMHLKNILIHRQEHTEADVSQVFWLSFVMGICSTILIVIAAPICGIILHDNRVVPLVFLAATSSTFSSLQAIYAANLSCKMQFKAIAQIQFKSGLINNFGAILLAVYHFGAYSLVLPMIVSSMFALFASRLASGSIPISRPYPSKWPELLSQAGLLMLNAILSALLVYGATFVISLQHNATITGYYFWGTSLATQAVFLLASNLQGVLFPVLTKLNLDPIRQYDAFRKACTVLLIATLPLCLLQILLAEPVVRLIFHDRWLPAVGVVQWLSVGLITQSISIMASSLLLARGAFGANCWITGVSAFLTIIAVAVGGMVGEQVAIARAVGLVTLFINLIPGLFALRLMGQKHNKMIELFNVPVLISIPIFTLAVFINRASVSLGPIYQILIVTVFTVLLYFAAAFILVPEVKSTLRYWRKPVQET